MALQFLNPGACVLSWLKCEWAPGSPWGQLSRPEWARAITLLRSQFHASSLPFQHHKTSCPLLQDIVNARKDPAFPQAVLEPAMYYLYNWSHSTFDSDPGSTPSITINNYRVDTLLTESISEVKFFFISSHSAFFLFLSFIFYNKKFTFINIVYNLLIRQNQRRLLPTYSAGLIYLFGWKYSDTIWSIRFST